MHFHIDTTFMKHCDTLAHISNYLLSLLCEDLKMPPPPQVGRCVPTLVTSTPNMGRHPTTLTKRGTLQNMHQRRSSTSLTHLFPSSPLVSSTRLSLKSTNTLQDSQLPTFPCTRLPSSPSLSSILLCYYCFILDIVGLVQAVISVELKGNCFP